MRPESTGSKRAAHSLCIHAWSWLRFLFLATSIRNETLLKSNQAHLVNVVLTDPIIALMALVTDDRVRTRGGDVRARGLCAYAPVFSPRNLLASNATNETCDESEWAHI
jgi:hypothetical protein